MVLGLGNWRFLKSLGLEKSKLPLEDFIGEGHKGGLGTSADQKRHQTPWTAVPGIRLMWVLGTKLRSSAGRKTLGYLSCP